MASVSTVVHAAPERVFMLLEDARSLENVVVGSRKIRWFDPRWPDLHTELHHSVGIPPLVLRDSTQVMEVAPPTRLVLEARFRPVGVMNVEFTLRPHPEGTELVIDEYPIAGPIHAPLLRPLTHLLIRYRNHEMGRRMRRLVDAREAIGDGRGPTADTGPDRGA